MATIRDVALRAQVSVATVSRVLNDSGYADPETRARVQKAVAELNYRRNVNWSRLKSRSSQTALFLLGNRQSLNSMQMRLLIACERTLHGDGYDLLFTRHDYSGDARAAELTLPRLLEQEGALDGVILAGIHYPNLLQALNRRKIPYVLLGNNFQGPAPLVHNAVLYDDQGGIFEAAGHLIRLGHRRIAFAGNATLPWFERRARGYRQAMSSHGLEELMVDGDWQVNNIDYGQLATAQLLRHGQPPTAIIAGNDEIAAGVWKELIRRKVAIPRQMSLVGLGDRAEFSILEPSLTSVSVFEDQLGERLTAMLLKRIQGGRLEVPSETYPCKLVERASSGPCQEPTPISRAVWK